MDKIQISGQKKLKERLRLVDLKNSCLPILVATLLSDKKKKLKNVPRLSDVFLMIKILKSLNSNISLKKISVKLEPLCQKALMFLMI